MRPCLCFARRWWWRLLKRRRMQWLHWHTCALLLLPWPASVAMRVRQGSRVVESR